MKLTCGCHASYAGTMTRNRKYRDSYSFSLSIIEIFSLVLLHPFCSICSKIYLVSFNEYLSPCIYDIAGLVDATVTSNV